MNLLRKIFTDESTAYIGLCKFKTAKVTSPCSFGEIKFSTPQKIFFVTDFSKNILL